MTLLAAAIMVGRLDQALAESAKAAEQGADLVEFRLDQIASDPTAERVLGDLVTESALPCIITCRPTWEGGAFDGDEQTRLTAMESACAAPRQPAYLDIELAAYQTSGEVRHRINQLVAPPQPSHQVSHKDPHPGGDETVAAKPGLILSYHDFEARPADLDSRLATMADTSACRVIKVAWSGRSLRDNIEAFEIVSRRLKPTIALCMGEVGLASRVLAKKFGALLTFAAVDDQTGTAPGQPTVRQLKQLYRWDHLGPRTRVFGVIGHPVGHSLSPHIHNRGFDQAEVDAVYLPLPIPPEYEHFKATLLSWLDYTPLQFGGASVTIPHKQNLIRFVREMGGEVEPLAQTIGAANTLSIADDGKTLHASNTDYAAALDAVCQGLGIIRQDLAGVDVAVIGAGGAARAVVAGFSHYQAHVVVYNRSQDKAEALAWEFADKPGHVVAAPWDQLGQTGASVIINCTPIGMAPEVEKTPLTQAQLAERCQNLNKPPLVFDTIYNPERTRLLREAEAAGCPTVVGTEMFILQGAAQFERWTGKTAPLKTFRQALGEAKAEG